MNWGNRGWQGVLHLFVGVVLAVALGVSGPAWAQSGSSGAVYYLHTDHLNTPRLVTDEQATVVWRQLPLAEPFGMAPPEEDPDGNGIPFNLNLRFPGQYFDRETNTHYNYFRDYNPQTGRYLQSDPIGLQGGINTYGYVEGNPISRTDPSGLETQYSIADLAIVEGHLRSIASLQGDDFNSSQSFAPERAMLDRLKRGMDSSFDIGFLRHERLEADICKQKFKGLNPKNLNQEEIQRLLREAHDETLATQGNRSSDLYHPNVLAKYPRWVW